MWEMGNVRKYLVRKAQRKRPTRKWEDYTPMDLTKVGCELDLFG